MKTLFVAALAIAVVALPIPLASAQQPPVGFGFGNGLGYGMGWMHQPGRGRSMMMDANDDGVISAEEAASAADEVFSAMDANDDGILTEGEYMAVRMGPQYGYNADRQAAMQTAKAGRFASIDANADGAVSKAEFLDAAQAHFKDADDDTDGQVTPWEFRRHDWN